MKNGRSVIIAVPFDQQLLEDGVHCAFALNFFEAGQLPLVQAAKVAACGLSFLRHSR